MLAMAYKATVFLLIASAVGAESASRTSSRQLPTGHILRQAQPQDQRLPQSPAQRRHYAHRWTLQSGAPVAVVAQKQTDIRQYELWKSEEIATTVKRWAEHYPNLLRVTTSQEAYGLPTAGGQGDCIFDASEGSVGCRNYILTIQDFVAHPEDSASSRRLPELLWSGELHGNERVGPTAVLEATQLLLDAATCEARPRLALQPTNTAKEAKTSAVWLKELEAARDCRADLAAQGINDEHRTWLARLVSTRRIVVIPTANALGYDQNVREENGMDPNRDFPYDLSDATQCMQTIAGRTVNEVFRNHLFQLSLTFHGGMEVIGYEWGAPHWKNKRSGVTLPSPDNAAQAAIAQAYSAFAGGWATTKPYDTGPYVYIYIKMIVENGTTGIGGWGRLCACARAHELVSRGGA
jgi:Zinc carboxypeptidase